MRELFHFNIAFQLSKNLPMQLACAVGLHSHSPIVSKALKLLTLLRLNTMTRVTRVLLGAMLFVGIISAAMAQPIAEVAADTSEDAPPGVTVLSLVQEVLIRPRGSVTASKRTVVKKRGVVNRPLGPAVGGRTVVKKRTTVKRRGGVAISGFYSKRELSDAIEATLTNSESRSDDSVAQEVASMLGYESSSDSTTPINQQLKELLQYRSDPAVLHERVQAFVGSIVEDDDGGDDDGSKDNSGDDNGDHDNDNDNGSDNGNDNDDKSGDNNDDNDGDSAFGYRTLYRRTVSRRTTYGWRYPRNYWNLYGPSLYPGPCYFGMAYGRYFYC